MEFIRQHIDINAIVYDYQINFLKNSLENKSDRGSAFDIPQMILHIHNHFNKPPEKAKCLLTGSRISINPGRSDMEHKYLSGDQNYPFADASPHSLFELIRTHSNSYNITSFESRNLSNMLLIDPLTNEFPGVSEDVKSKLKIVVLYLEDDTYRDANALPESKYSINEVNNTFFS